MLKDECLQLKYTASSELNDTIFTDTLSQLESLYEKYGCAEVLSELHELWEINKAAKFFMKVPFSTRARSEVKTVAASYIRAYGGGAQKVLCELITLWCHMGYRVILFTDTEPNELDFYYPEDVKRIIIPSADTSLRDRLCAIAKAIEEEHIDVFVDHNWLAESLFWQCVLARTLHVSYIVHTHNLLSVPYMMGCDAMHTPCTYSVTDMVISLVEANSEYFRLCGCRSYLVQNPTSKELMDIGEPASLNSTHIVVVGRLSYEKRPMDAIAVFKKVHDERPDAVLDFVGPDNGNYTDEINRFCEEYGLKDSVKLHGELSPEAVGDIMHDAAMMLLTSEVEGYGLVLIESKAHGLPIVMYDLPYLSTVKDRKGILTSEIGDIDNMASDVLKLLNDDALRHRYGNESLDSFEQFKTYDLEGTWRNIFELSAVADCDIRPAEYYDPADLSDTEKFISPLLLNALLDNLHHKPDVYATADYRLGHRLLKIPRLIKHSVRKIFGNQKS